MDPGDQLRLGQREQVVVAAQVATEAAEALAPIAVLVELVALDHGAHRAVEQHDALLEELAQARDPGLAGAAVQCAHGIRCGGGLLRALRRLRQPGQPGQPPVVADAAAIGRMLFRGSRRARRATGAHEPTAGVAAAAGRNPSAWQIA